MKIKLRKLNVPVHCKVCGRALRKDTRRFLPLCFIHSRLWDHYILLQKNKEKK